MGSHCLLAIPMCAETNCLLDYSIASAQRGFGYCAALKKWLQGQIFIYNKICLEDIKTKNYVSSQLVLIT